MLDGVRDTYIQVYEMLVSLVISLYGYIPFQQVQESQRCVDPKGSIIRCLHVQRRYSVPGPRHLWQADGNHKLIRYAAIYITYA